MIFADKFAEICEVLDIRSKAFRNLKPNSADLGELCEIFVKEALAEIISGSLRVNRGGYVIDSLGNRSKQVDIVVTQGNSLGLYADKGMYPIESVCGIFCITSTLTREKLKEDIQVLGSIPVDNLHFMALTSDFANKMDQLRQIWQMRCPYRCIFAYDGEIREDWKTILNEEITSNKIPKERMPNLIVVNKKALFQRLETEKMRKTNVDAGFGESSDEYAFIPLPDEHKFAAISLILTGLNGIGQLQYAIQPDYPAYFKI